jgi:hypothetical protein
LIIDPAIIMIVLFFSMLIGIVFGASRRARRRI